MGALTSTPLADSEGSVPRRSPLEGVAIAEEVASALRHDLRNRLGSIRNSAFYVQRSLARMGLLDRDERIEKFLHLICEQVEAADALLDQRSRYPHLLHDEAGLFTVGLAVREVIRRSIFPAGIELELLVDETLGVRGNFDELTLCLQCLVDNAIEVVPPGGTIRIEVRESAARVVMSVSDDGVGIAPECREQALEAFVSTKPGHAGLGLNIAARIAKRHGGKLTLSEPETGPGLLVLVSLPRAM
jgi:signal transduction histidine kinase